MALPNHMIKESLWDQRESLFPTSFIWEPAGLDSSSDPLKRKDISMGNKWIQKPPFKGESMRELLGVIGNVSQLSKLAGEWGLSPQLPSCPSHKGWALS